MLVLASACAAEDPSGTWTGTAQLNVLGQLTNYELDIDLERDEEKYLYGEGVLVTAGVPIDVTVQGEQSYRRVEFDILPSSDGIDSFLKTEFIKGRLKGDTIDGKLSVGVSLAKVKADMLLRRQ